MGFGPDLALQDRQKFLVCFRFLSRRTCWPLDQLARCSSLQLPVCSSCCSYPCGDSSHRDLEICGLPTFAVLCESLAFQDAVDACCDAFRYLSEGFRALPCPLCKDPLSLPCTSEEESLATCLPPSASQYVFHSSSYSQFSFLHCPAIIQNYLVLVFEVSVAECYDVLWLLPEDLSKKVMQNFGELFRYWELLQICTCHSKCFIIILQFRFK